MKKLPVILISLITLLYSCDSADKKIQIENETDSLSYGIGISLGKDIKNNFKSIQLDTIVDYEKLILGLKEYLDTTSVFTIQPEEAEVLVEAYFKKQQEQERMLYLAGFEANKIAGEKFIADNKSKEGVEVLPNGVQYKEIKRGWGPKPELDDTVRIHYHGTLIDGTVFDSSVERDKPVEFPVMGLIPGFSSALQNMKVGAKWIVYIPQELAYGENVNPEGIIKPYSALVFEIELQRIVSKKKKIVKPAATATQQTPTPAPSTENVETKTESTTETSATPTENQ